MSHTPGPWIAEDHEERGPRMVYAPSEIDGYHLAIALVYDNYPDANGRTAYDNAHLIAAAPSLLEAVTLALPFVEGKNERVEQVLREAKAKAEGERQ